MAWDESNDVSNDTLEETGLRASLMQENIGTMGPIIGLPLNLSDWGATCSDVWNQALTTADVEDGEKQVAFEEHRLKLASGYDMTVKVKAALVAIIKDTERGEELLDEYGARGETPRSLGKLLRAMDRIKETHDRLVAAGDERVLPDPIIEKLVSARTDINTYWHTAQKERQESAKAYDVLHALQGEYAQKFRGIYSLAVISLGKYSPDLLLLGFAPATPPAGHGQPNIPSGLTTSYTGSELTVSCDPDDHATSYQFKYSVDADEYFELYQGDQNSYTYEPPNELRYYKVRARNVNGFSKWSEVVEFDPPDTPV